MRCVKRFDIYNNIPNVHMPNMSGFYNYSLIESSRGAAGLRSTSIHTSSPIIYYHYLVTI